MSPLASSAIRRVRWLTVPLGAYLVITLLLPMANGATSRSDFVHHAAWVVGSCLAMLGICVAIPTLLDVVRLSLWRNR